MCALLPRLVWKEWYNNVVFKRFVQMKQPRYNILDRARLAMTCLTNLKPIYSINLNSSYKHHLNHVIQWMAQNATGELHFESVFGPFPPHQSSACRQDGGLRGLYILQLDNKTKANVQLTLANSPVHIVYRHKHSKKNCTVHDHLTGSDWQTAGNGS